MKKITKILAIPLLLMVFMFTMVKVDAQDFKGNEKVNNVSSKNTRAVGTFNLEDWQYDTSHDNILIISGLNNQGIKDIYIPSYVIVDGVEREVRMRSLAMFNKQEKDSKRFESIIFDAIAPSQKEGPVKKVTIDTWDIENAFANHPVLKKADMTGLEVSNIQKMTGLFNGSGLQELDVSGWNVSKVKDFSSVFAGLQKLSDIDLSSWDTSSATNLSGMFRGSGMNKLDLNNFNTSNVTNFSGVFSSMSKLENIKLDKWDTSEGIDFSNMFSNMTKLTELDLSTFKTTNAKDMSSMFYGTANLGGDLLNISSFDTKNVTNFSYMFAKKSFIRTLNISHLDLSSAETTEGMFQDVDVYYYDAEGGLPKKGTLDVSKFNMSNVKNTSFMFENVNAETLDVSNWNVDKVENMYCMFKNMNNLNGIDVSKWNVNKVNDMTEMFYGTYELLYIDATNWKINNTNAATSQDIFMLPLIPKPLVVKTTDSFLLGYDYKSDNRITAGPKKDAIKNAGKFLSDGSIIQEMFDRFTIQDISELMVTPQQYDEFMKEEPVHNNPAYEFVKWNPEYKGKTEVTNLLKDLQVYKAVYQPIQTKVDYKVTKVWDDGNNQDGLRESDIQVQLKAGTENVGTPITLNEANAWTHTWKDLNKKDGAQEIIYSVDELNLGDKYTSKKVENSKYESTITNTHTPEKMDIEGVKSWLDNDNQDGIRPTKVVIKLMDGTREVAQTEATKDGLWKYEFKNQPVYRNGSKITYTLKEVGVDKYKASYDGYNITNTYTPSKVSYKVTKKWVDGENQDGIRSENIQVQLKKGTENAGTAITLNEANNWTYTWDGLDAQAGGNPIEYSVAEISAVPGYDTETVKVDENESIITNTHKPETVDIAGTKSWIDGNNQDGNRPDSIVVKLMDGTREVARKTVDKNDWSYEFKDQPVYKAGKKINYTLKEEGVTGYTTTYEGNNIINTYAPGKVSKTVSKVWDDKENQDGIRPGSVEVELKAGNVVKDTKVLTKDNNWTYTWSDLDAKAGGSTIVYTVDEKEVPTKYTKDVKDTAEATTITNSYTPETTKVEGTKTWKDNDNQDNKRPESIKVNLLVGGVKKDQVEVNASTNWKYSFVGLPKKANGVDINYTLSEEGAGEYTPKFTGYDIENSYTPGKTSVSVDKVWTDGNNQDGLRKDKVEVKLVVDGTAKDEVVELNAGNNWKYTWPDLDVMSKGKKITYSVEEVNVPDGYIASVNDTNHEAITLTNTHTPEVRKISGEKKWVDNDNQDGKRPQSITINLLADNSKVASTTTDSSKNWKYEFNNQPVNAGGEKITYSVQEVGASGYTPSYDDNYNITNSYTPGETSVNVTKVWTDGENQDGNRPDSIDVQLKAGTNVKETVTLNAKNNWTHNFTNLPEMEAGNKIDYTVDEVNVPSGYSLGKNQAGNNVTLTNTYAPKTTKVEGTKTWTDGN
ncbi:MAG: Cna B-type domain-containing protein, partial [Erysipelotrichales bacterium]